MLNFIKSIVLWPSLKKKCLCKIIWLANAVFVQVTIFKNILPTGGGKPNLVYLVTRGHRCVPSASDSCPELSSLGCSEILKKPLAFCRITPLVWLTIKIASLLLLIYYRPSSSFYFSRICYLEATSNPFHIFCSTPLFSTVAMGIPTIPFI